MKKKLFGIGLCVLLVGVLALSASATGVIDHVAVTGVVEPVPEARMNFDVTMETSVPYKLLQDGRHIYWVDEEGDVIFTDNQINEFAEGKAYTILIYIEPKSGYAFPNNLEQVTATVNGQIAELKFDDVNDAYFILARFDPCGSVENIEINYTAPVVGKVPNFDKVENYRYTSTGSVSPRTNGISWYDDTAGKYLYNGTGQKFESHHVYSVTFALESEMYTVQTAQGNVDKYYEFTGNTKATVNGNPAASVDLYENGGDWIWANVKYTFGETGCAPEFVQGEFPSCNGTGHVGYFACSCGKWYWDEEATNPIEDKEEIVIPPTGAHSGGTATCTEKAKCSVCGKTYGSLKAHTYKTVTTKATLSKNGKIESKCSCGKVKSTQTIAKISSVTLSATKYIHDGKNKTPTVTVKDANGKKLVKNTDYKLSVASKRSGIGKYTVKVTFIGKYSGTKNVYFTILPGKPASVKSAAQTTSSVKLTWSKVSGAAGYTVYRYSPSKKAYVKAGTTEGTSLTVKGLLTGTKYTFKVVAYGKTSGGKVYNSEGYTLLKTATKTKTPAISKIATTKGKAVLTHTNVSGETGYTVYYSTKKDSGFKKYANFKADTKTATVTGLTSGKTYYFKVRTYITTDSGYVYSPWSAVKGIKVK